MTRLLTKYLFLLLFLAGLKLHAQPSPSAIRITYIKSSNGKPVENQDPVIVFSNVIRTVITSVGILDKKSKHPFEESIIDRQTGKHYIIAHLNHNELALTIDSTGLGNQIFEISKETKTILGYQCKNAKAVINSNTIDLWYTTELKLKGAPTVLGQNLGLVLEMERNNNFAITATSVEKLRRIPKNVGDVPRRVRPVDMLTFRDKLWQSRFTRIDVFKNETINFVDRPRSNDSIKRYAGGTVIVRKIKFPEIEPGSRIFVDATVRSNGDAYDRTGSVFIMPSDQKTTFMKGIDQSFRELPYYENGNGKKYHGAVITENYIPPVELMRFFTSFGIGHYNTIKLKGKTWQDSVLFRQDVSELYPLLSQREVWIGANIGNYDKGGHKISVGITIHPEQSPPPGNNFALPLFATNNILEMEGQEYSTMFDHENGLKVGFTLARPLKNARLRYITTGHGGWERGDEFLPKKNTISLNGRDVFQFIPWRTDCGSFRSYNPASGNFGNGLSSSDYSRSNWCPGTVTVPEFIELGDLVAGDHSLQIRIPQGEPEGNSFSSWVVSGVLLGDR